MLGTAPDGYRVDGITTEQNQLRISGPASAIDAVAQAAVEVDVTGFTADIGTDATIRLYDEAGDEVDRASITKNISSVRANITILQTKWVALHVTPLGTPAPGFVLAGEAETSPSSILLAGRQNVLSAMETLEVTDSALDVSGLTQDLTTSINVRNALPSGTKFGDADFNGAVTVVIPIEPDATLPEEAETAEDVTEGEETAENAE